MKAQTKLFLFALPMLFASTLGAIEPTQWDAMRGTYAGDITITTNSGKQVKGKGNVVFALDAVTLARVSYSRADVKEVVIRRPRGTCCDSLAVGVLPFLLLVEGIAKHDIPKDSLSFVIIISPVIVGAAAVTGPPLLVIEGVRRLIPAEVAYRVVP
jgi:hypothetical protein